MTLNISYRPQNYPTNFPPSQFYGTSSVNLTTGNTDIDIFQLVDADITPALVSFPPLSFYRVIWKLRLEINQNNATNLSTYFGNPIRTNYGICAFSTLRSVESNILINYSSQILGKRNFICLGGNIRLPDAVNDATSFVGTGNQFVQTQHITPNIGILQNVYEDFGYADIARIALYNPISAIATINYQCTLLWYNLDGQTLGFTGI